LTNPRLDRTPKQGLNELFTRVFKSVVTVVFQSVSLENASKQYFFLIFKKLFLTLVYQNDSIT
jgi:hypothetical protein